MALSLIVVFLYGSMVWGLYPQNTGISWEGHLSGAVTGLVCAFIYPIKKLVHDLDGDVDEYDTTFEGADIEIKYHYTSEKEKNE